MPKAFVLIDTDTYSAEEVLKELGSCKDVQECLMVTGAYDIVAKVEAETLDQLVDIINRRIERLFQVQETLSLMIVEQQGSGQDEKNEVIAV